MDDALAVLSASTDNIHLMHHLLATSEHGQWLPQFYQQRKGTRSKEPACTTS